jgi:hypothetical protein
MGIAAFEGIKQTLFFEQSNITNLIIEFTFTNLLDKLVLRRDAKSV